ncbi:MAG: hypothetical protein L0Y72_05290 [Gemmataceae bacterium]|nr:hypothetical protein [Gemmataceae bacterium]
MARTTVAQWGSCIFLLLLVVTRTYSQEETARWLEKNIESQRLLNHYSAEGKIESSLYRLTGPFRQRDVFNLKKHGELYYVTGSTTFLDKHQDQSYRFFAVSNQDYAVEYSLRKEKRAKSAIAAKKEKQRILKRQARFAHLDGIVGDDGSSLSALLLKSGRHAFIGNESINNIECKIIEGETGQGKARLWVSDQRAFAILKYVFEKGPNDIHDGVPLQKQPEFHEWKDDETRVRWSAVLDNVRLGQFRDFYFPIGGSLTVVTKLSSGREIKEVSTIRRDNMQLSPAFTEKDFAIDLADGTGINFLDDLNSGLEYEWVGNNVVVSGSQFSGTAQGSWQSRWFFRILGGTLGILLIAVAIRVARRIWWET